MNLQEIQAVLSDLSTEHLVTIMATIDGPHEPVEFKLAQDTLRVLGVTAEEARAEINRRAKDAGETPNPVL